MCCYWDLASPPCVKFLARSAAATRHCVLYTGAVAARLRVYDSSICFICAHLASGENEGDELKRNYDYSEIVRRGQFPPDSASLDPETSFNGAQNNAQQVLLVLAGPDALSRGERFLTGCFTCYAGQGCIAACCRPKIAHGHQRYSLCIMDPVAVPYLHLLLHLRGARCSCGMLSCCGHDHVDDCRRCKECFSVSWKRLQKIGHPGQDRAPQLWSGQCTAALCVHA